MEQQLLRWVRKVNVIQGIYLDRTSIIYVGELFGYKADLHKFEIRAHRMPRRKRNNLSFNNQMPTSITTSYMCMNSGGRHFTTVSPATISFSHSRSLSLSLSLSRCFLLLALCYPYPKLYSYALNNQVITRTRSAFNM